MLPENSDPESLAGLEVVDRHGERVGRVRQVYPDGAGAGWVGLRGNLLGTAEVLVPLDGAVLDDDVITLPVSRERVRTAPRREPDQDLSPEESERLRAFYDEPAPAETGPVPVAAARPTGPVPVVAARQTGPVPVVAARPAAPAPAPAATAAPAATPVPVAHPEDDAAAMTLSEERLRIDTEEVPRTRVRLVKVVVTEEQTITVPVRREEVRLVREPIVDGEPGGTISEDETELILHEERIVVSTEVVPVERVRLVREQVTEQRAVSRPVRKERIEFDDGEAPATGSVPTLDESGPVETATSAAPLPQARAPRKRPAGAQSGSSAASRASSTSASAS